MSDFAKLRKASSVTSLQKAIEKSSKKSYGDERYWKPTTDKQGNGWAIIRFLPAGPADGVEADPYVMLFTHFFKGPGGQIYAERSLTTLGQKDPLGELNSQLWSAGGGNRDTSECKQATTQKRKKNYVSNILVVEDPGKPENNGKVFLYSYGTKIFEKIQDKSGAGEAKDSSLPPDPDDVKFNPYNMWDGANFKLNVRKVANFPNYDKSEFKAQSPIASSDADIEKIWKTCYSLKAELAPEKFKSYDELQKLLDTVLHSGGGRAPVHPSRQSEDNQRTPEVPSKEEVAADLRKAMAPTSTVSEDEDDFSAFQELAGAGD